MTLCRSSARGICGLPPNSLGSDRRAATTGQALTRVLRPLTVPGHVVATLELAAAANRHDIASGERASLLLRDALFEQGRDISCPDELAAVAEAITLPGPISTADQVLADWHEGQRRASSADACFVGDTDYFCPALRTERIDGHLRITCDLDRFDEFIRRCRRQLR